VVEVDVPRGTCARAGLGSISPRLEDAKIGKMFHVEHCTLLYASPAPHLIHCSTWNKIGVHRNCSTWNIDRGRRVRGDPPFFNVRRVRPMSVTWRTVTDGGEVIGLEGGDRGKTGVPGSIEGLR